MSRAHEDRVGEEYWGVPDLVVEVISPRTEQSSGTEDVDRGDKFREYAQAGVPEYWLVDPVVGTVEGYVLQQRSFHLLGCWGRGEVARSQVLPDLLVPVDALIGR